MYYYVDKMLPPIYHIISRYRRVLWSQPRHKSFALFSLVFIAKKCLYIITWLLTMISSITWRGLKCSRVKFISCCSRRYRKFVFCMPTVKFKKFWPFCTSYPKSNYLLKNTNDLKSCWEYCNNYWNAHKTF